MFETPVTEGYDNVRKLETFGFVDRDDAYTVNLVALYCLARDCLIPFLKEERDQG